MSSGKSNKKIVVFGVVALVIGLLIWYIDKNNDPKFEINTNMLEKVLYDDSLRAYYVVENGVKKEVFITKDSNRCEINSIKSNQNGVTAFDIYMFSGSTIADKPLGKPFKQEKYPIARYYVLFINDDGKIKFKEFDRYIQGIEWIDSENLQVLMKSDTGNMDKISVNNPF